jgi:hypothetical protein
VSRSKAEWFDPSGVSRLIGELDGDFGGAGFVGWTQGSDDAVVVTLADATVPPLQFKPAAGATANATDQIEWYDDAGNLMGYVDATGSISMSAPVGAGGGFDYTADGGAVLIAAGATARMGNDLGATIAVDLTSVTVQTTLLGFYNAAAVARPVVPLTSPTVQNVIDALVALGLIVQHD